MSYQVAVSEQLRQKDELEWLTEVLGGFVDGPSTRYLCRPSTGQPQLLVPLAPTRVTRTSMRRDHDDRDLKTRLQGMAGEATARLGLLRFAGGEVIDLPPFGLIRQFEQELNEDRLLATISLGPRRRNRKPVLQLIRPNGEPVAFVKVGWSGLTKELVANEAHWLEAIRGKLPPGVAAPQLLGRIKTETIDAVASTPLPVKSRGRRTQMVDPTVISHLARIDEKDPLPFAQLPAVVEWGQGPMADVLDIERLLDHHGETVLSTGLWHGDLTPWNTASGKNVMYLWDWEFSGTYRPVGFDSLHESFERSRRASAMNEQVALDLVIEQAQGLLAPYLGANATAGNTSAQPTGSVDAEDTVDAIVDLYLCELVAREFRLAGEGWKPSNLGPLDRIAQQTLQRRLTQ